MEYLATKCTVIEPSKIKTFQAEGADLVVAITFDDAFVSVMENAAPSLKEYQLPAGILRYDASSHGAGQCADS